MVKINDLPEHRAYNELSRRIMEVKKSTTLTEWQKKVITHNLRETRDYLRRIAVRRAGGSE